MLKKRNKSWLDRLPVDPRKLSFEELKDFKFVDKYLTESIDGPEGWSYCTRAFRFLTAFSMWCLYENKYPPFTKCWNELEKYFMNEEIFNDGVFVQAWIFINFPFGNNGETIIDYFSRSLENEFKNQDFDYFVNIIKESRLGLYQEILSSKKTTRFRELITGRVINTIRSVEHYEKGEIFLTRFVEYKGDIFQFGDPKCWPSEYRLQLENIVKDKLIYFDGKSVKEKYENFMRLAGPYWMSCVTSNTSFPILEPDHYKYYLEANGVSR